MIKAVLIRTSGLVLALMAFAPAFVAILKATNPQFIRLFSGLFVPIWWWKWIWTWMPAIRCPILTWDDLRWSLPGLLPISLVGIGLAVALGKRKTRTVHRWEDGL